MKPSIDSTNKNSGMPSLVRERLSEFNNLTAHVERVHLAQMPLPWEAQTDDNKHSSSNSLDFNVFLTQELVNYRKIVAYAISQIFSFVEIKQQKGELGRNIPARIAEGHHPLDAIYCELLTDISREVKFWRDNIFIRDENLHAQLRLFSNTVMQDPENRSIETTVTRGTGTGLRIVVACLELLSSSWQRENGTPIPPKELELALTQKTILPLLSIWKGMPVTAVNKFEEIVMMRETIRLYDDYKYRVLLNPSYFELCDFGKKAVGPVPSRKLIAKLAEMDLSDPEFPVRTYCPADSAYALPGPISSQTSPRSNASFLQKTIEWTNDLAIRNWLPWYKKWYANNQSKHKK